MKIALTVHGNEIVFSESELVRILEAYYPIPDEENTRFLVKPSEIKWKNFEKARCNQNEEVVRKLILKARQEIKKLAPLYERPFELFVPENNSIGYSKVVDMANSTAIMNGSIANWIEQALEWAQRIQNGESWEFLCQIPDHSKWRRLVKWGDGFYRIVGGSRIVGDRQAKAHVYDCQYAPMDILYNTVPLVVRYM